MCTGALTLDGDHVQRLVAFYTVAQVSKFVPPGSVLIDSGEAASIPNDPAGSKPDELLSHVAFRTPAGRDVLLVANPSAAEQPFTVRAGAKTITTTLAAGAVMTLVW